MRSESSPVASDILSVGSNVRGQPSISEGADWKAISSRCKPENNGQHHSQQKRQKSPRVRCLKANIWNKNSLYPMFPWLKDYDMATSKRQSLSDSVRRHPLFPSLLPRNISVAENATISVCRHSPIRKHFIVSTNNLGDIMLRPALSS